MTIYAGLHISDKMTRICGWTATQDQVVRCAGDRSGSSGKNAKWLYPDLARVVLESISGRLR